MANIRIQKDPLYTFKKIFRTAKTFAPSLTDAKYEGQRLGRSLIKKPHEKDFRALAMLNELKAQEDFVFIDIGANRGQTIDSVRLYKNYKIYSIEANTLLAKKLKRQRVRDNRLEILNYAMSDTVGQSTLYIPKYRNYLFDGLASMIRDEAFTWLDESRIYGFSKKLLSIVEMRVPTTTLDDLNLAPDFIKIDVQGAEMAVLRGARETLQKHKPILLVELPTHEAEGRFLAMMGYQPYYYLNGRFYVGISKHGNSFFLAQHHLAYLPATAFVLT